MITINKLKKLYLISLSIVVANPFSTLLANSSFRRNDDELYRPSNSTSIDRLSSTEKKQEAQDKMDRGDRGYIANTALEDLSPKGIVSHHSITGTVSHVFDATSSDDKDGTGQKALADYVGGIKDKLANASSPEERVKILKDAGHDDEKSFVKLENAVANAGSKLVIETDKEGALKKVTAIQVAGEAKIKEISVDGAPIAMKSDPKVLADRITDPKSTHFSGLSNIGQVIPAGKLGGEKVYSETNKVSEFNKADIAKAKAFVKYAADENRMADKTAAGITKALDNPDSGRLVKITFNEKGEIKKVQEIQHVFVVDLQKNVDTAGAMHDNDGNKPAVLNAVVGDIAKNVSGNKAVNDKLDEAKKEIASGDLGKAKETIQAAIDEINPKDIKAGATATSAAAATAPKTPPLPAEKVLAVQQGSSEAKQEIASGKATQNTAFARANYIVNFNPQGAKQMAKQAFANAAVSYGNALSSLAKTFEATYGKSFEQVARNGHSNPQAIRLANILVQAKASLMQYDVNPRGTSVNSQNSLLKTAGNNLLAAANSFEQMVRSTRRS